jgi:hypothetical protein
MPITFVGDFQAPDRLQGSMTAKAQGATITVALIAMGDTVYIKDPNTGKWVVTSGSAAPFLPQDFTGIKPSELKGLKLVGEENLGGSPAYHLAGEATFPLNFGQPVGPIKGTFQTEYWIDKENSRIVQAAIDGKVPITGTVEATVAMSVTIQFSSYGSPVLIEAPQMETLQPTPVP